MSKPQSKLEINIPEDLLQELLTDSELRMVAQRLKIMQFLEEGKSIRSIAKEMNVGTDTVVRMARKLEQNPTLKKTFQKFNSPKSSSQWVFGQSKKA